ncbi:hypothetical protein BC455_15000 [Vibrio harveyi]|nr:hypothetical protein BC455_15000 [Vibrio harveyi]
MIYLKIMANLYNINSEVTKKHFKNHLGFSLRSFFLKAESEMINITNNLIIHGSLVKGSPSLVIDDEVLYLASDIDLIFISNESRSQINACQKKLNDTLKASFKKILITPSAKISIHTISELKENKIEDEGIEHSYLHCGVDFKNWRRMFSKCGTFIHGDINKKNRVLDVSYALPYSLYRMILWSENEIENRISIIYELAKGINREIHGDRDNKNAQVSCYSSIALSKYIEENISTVLQRIIIDDELAKKLELEIKSITQSFLNKSEYTEMNIELKVSSLKYLSSQFPDSNLELRINKLLKSLCYE